MSLSKCSNIRSTDGRRFLEYNLQKKVQKPRCHSQQADLEAYARAFQAEKVVYLGLTLLRKQEDSCNQRGSRQAVHVRFLAFKNFVHKYNSNSFCYFLRASGKQLPCHAYHTRCRPGMAIESSSMHLSRKGVEGKRDPSLVISRKCGRGSCSGIR